MCAFLNKKKLLSLALCAVLLSSCLFFTDKVPHALSAGSTIYESAEPVTPPESDFTYKATPTANPTKAIITGYTGKETKVIIPETLGGLPVANIAANAFAGNERLTYVKLPANLISISGAAFTKCSALTEIDVDSENERFSVVDGVLYRNDTNVDSETYGSIKTLIIYPCGKGGKFTVPRSVETIGSYAFSYCFNLTEVDMYNNVTLINDGAFSYCWNLQRIRLSDNLTYLGKKALAYCESLKRIDLPSNLTNIGDDAVLGTIDSDNNKVYFFVDGISCKKESYAYDYLIEQGLPENIIIQNHRTVTDNDTRIRLIDAYNVLPDGVAVDISVTPVELSEVEKLFPTRYSRAFAFDIGITSNGAPYTLPGKVILSFDETCGDAIPSASKVYRQSGEKLILAGGSVHTPFIGTEISTGGRFVILVNDDFSLRGDIDGDGVVTLFDVRAALHACTGTLVLTKEQSAAANADNSSDGKITTEDARKILRMAGGME